MKLYTRASSAREAAKRVLSKGNLELELREGVDFAIVPQDGKFGWVVPMNVQGYNDEAATDEVAEAQAARETKIVEMANEMRRGLDATAAEDEAAVPSFLKKARRAAKVAREEHAVAATNEMLAANTIEPDPDRLVPDLSAGEATSGDCGLFTTRERAEADAKASGEDDVLINQTARGMWVWRTRRTQAFWDAKNVADLKLTKPKAAKADAVKRSPRGAGGSKLDIAEELLRRPEGATPEEIAEKVEGWDAKTAKIRIGTCLKLGRKLAIVCAVEEGRGRVYRLAAYH